MLKFFEYFKVRLKTVPVLAYAEIKKLYIFYTDTSGECTGACLCHMHDEDNNAQPGPPKETLLTCDP